jgi:hypothetical protein
LIENMATNPTVLDDLGSPSPFLDDKHNKTNSVAFSPQVNYTYWVTATCRRNLVPTFADRGVLRGSTADPHSH